LHLKLYEEFFDTDSSSSTTDTSVMCVENIVVTSETVEANSDLSPTVNNCNNECTIKTADEALETESPPKDENQNEFKRTAFMLIWCQKYIYLWKRMWHQ
jgi:hypothetical protein